MRALLWNWVVVGAVVLFLLGTGVSFMTSGRVLAADGFFVGSAILFFVKFLTWEEGHGQAKRVIAWGLLITSLVLAIAISGNHLMNASTGKSAPKMPPLPGGRQPTAILSPESPPSTPVIEPKREEYEV
jgi:hypothetical protein